MQIVPALADRRGRYRFSARPQVPETSDRRRDYRHAYLFAEHGDFHVDITEYHAHARIEAHRLKGPFIIAHRDLVVRGSEVIVRRRWGHAPCHDVAKVAYGVASFNRL